MKFNIIQKCYSPIIYTGCVQAESLEEARKIVAERGDIHWDGPTDEDCGSIGPRHSVIWELYNEEGDLLLTDHYANAITQNWETYPDY